MNYLPTCTSILVVQHPCQASFKSMQECRRSWEDKLKYVKILSVKDHKSAKICQAWIISAHVIVDLWYNICTKFHSNPCKDVGGVEKTNFDGTEWQTKQAFYGGGIKKKREEIWISPMTKAPTSTEKSKKQRDNTKTPTITSITKRLRTDLGRSVGVTIAIQLLWLNRLTGSHHSH